MGFVNTTDGERSIGVNAAANTSAPGPGSHRRPGRAAVRDPEPSFPKVLWDYPREPALVGLGGLLGLGWGVSTAVAVGPVLGRALGVVAAVAGLLVLVSYVLRFFPSALQGDCWYTTRPRRAVRLALDYAWGVFLVAALLAWVASLFVDY
jgi:hypothetical protein